jgi:Zn finger protein HypA/HybF involved in hydrogenase expression
MRIPTEWVCDNCNTRFLANHGHKYCPKCNSKKTHKDRCRKDFRDKNRIIYLR